MHIATWQLYVWTFGSIAGYGAYCMTLWHSSNEKKHRAPVSSKQVYIKVGDVDSDEAARQIVKLLQNYKRKHGNGPLGL